MDFLRRGCSWQHTLNKDEIPYCVWPHQTLSSLVSVSRYTEALAED